MPLLSEHTTLRIGGEPRTFTVATSEDQLIAAVTAADDEGRTVTLLGGGSNVVFSDSFRGDVIHVATRGIENDASVCAGAWVTVQAGHPWDDVVVTAVTQGWAGIEALSGIPGTAGATPIQNVGAYGQQVSDTIAQVRVWDRQRRLIRTLFAADCGFGYRTSTFKREPGRYVVLAVTYQLSLGTMSEPLRYAELAERVGVPLGGRAPLDQVRDVVLALRAAKGMLLDSADHDTWSAGSFFLNPEVDVPPPGAPAWSQADGRWKVSAAWLIEASGFPKGFGLNPRATLSTKHALAITNRGGASAADVVELAEHVRRGVADTFGIDVEFEPRVVD